VSENRAAARVRLIAARQALSGPAHAAASAAVLHALAARYPPGSLGLVAAYWPIGGEIDPLPYLRATLAAGEAVALPVVLRRNQPLVFRGWTPDAPMRHGPLGLAHPAEGPSVTPDALLVPLVGFGPAGHRLGFGGGYYDRTLPELNPRPLTIGLGFEAGRLDEFQAEPHDQRMDVIITEAGVFNQRIS
jgi:5-formyltetrahydrofolate cyclo-ligase